MKKEKAPPPPEFADGTLHYKDNKMVIVLVPENLMLYTMFWKGKGAGEYWQPGSLMRVHYRGSGSELEVLAMESLEPDAYESDEDENDEFEGEGDDSYE